MKRHFLTGLLLISVAAASTFAADKVPREGYFLVAGAFGGELQAVLDAVGELEIHLEEEINGIRFQIGEAYGLPVVFFLTQVGMTNAAMNTQLALSRYPVRAVLFSGIAGGINPELEKGDVVVPERWHYHDYGGYFNPETPGGDDYPQLVEVYGYRYDYPNFGMFVPSQVPAMRAGLKEAVRLSDFAVDPSLLELARRASANVELYNARGAPAAIVLGGVGASGNIFMDNADYRRYLRATWNSDSVDMETTAVAQVCWSNEVPFVAVRALSDLAGAQEGLNDLPEYAAQAWGNAGRLLGEMLRLLAEEQTEEAHGEKP